MKNILIASTLAVFLAGCTSSDSGYVTREEVQEKNTEAYDTTKAYVKQETQSTTDKVKNKMNELGAKLNRMKEQAQETVELEAKVHNNLQNLNREYKELEAEAKQGGKVVQDHIQTLENKIDSLGNSMSKEKTETRTTTTTKTEKRS